MSESLVTEAEDVLCAIPQKGIQKEKLVIVWIALVSIKVIAETALMIVYFVLSNKEYVCIYQP